MKFFKTTQSDLVKHNGKELTIIRGLKKGVEYDYIEGESPEMYLVELSTGERIQVFEDEIISRQDDHDYSPKEDRLSIKTGANENGNIQRFKRG